MPARYAANQRSRNASERAGRRVGKAESKRVAEYRVKGQGKWAARTTAPKNRRLFEDGSSAPKRKTRPSVSARVKAQNRTRRVLAEQMVLERQYKRKTGKVPTLPGHDAPGWPDNTPTQKRRRFQQKLGFRIN